MVCIYNGMLFNLTNKENIAIGKSMNNPGGHCTNWNKSDTKRQITICSHVSVKSRNIDAKSRVVVSRDWDVGEIGRCWSNSKNLL